MKKAKKLIVGNWKMNPQNLETVKKTFSGIKRAARDSKNTETIICPAFVHIAAFSKSAEPIMLGAQDLFFETQGSFTGQVSAGMLADLGVTHVIIGHSERRAQGETDDLVARKVRAAVDAGLVAILCIGEKTRDTQGEYLAFIKHELLHCLSKIEKKHLGNIIVAYEPIWAIGKSDKDAMKGNDMHETALYIKKVLSDNYGTDFVGKIKVLYGGSVSSFNAEDIVKNGHVDGLLIGRQSLNVDDFKEIIKIVDKI